MDTLLSPRRPAPNLATTQSATIRSATIRSATIGSGALFAPGALFAEDFDLPRGAAMPAPEVINPTYTAAELAEARAEAWAAGHAAGTTEANRTITATTQTLLEAIATALRDAKAAASTVAECSVEAIARLLLDSVAKLFPALCERHGEAELCALVHTILPALAQEPTITVRLNPMHTPALMRELDRLDPELVERVRLLPVEAIEIGDVRISWHDGSATRDTAALWQQVRAVLEPAGLLSPANPPTPNGPTPNQSAPNQSARDLATPDLTTPDLATPNPPTPNRAPITIMESANAD